MIWWGCICWNYQTWLVMIQYSILIPSFCLFNPSSFGGGITWCLLMSHDREIVDVYVIDKYPMFCAASRVLAIHFFDSVRVIRINWIRESIFSPASVVKRTTKSQRGSGMFLWYSDYFSYWKFASHNGIVCRCHLPCWQLTTHWRKVKKYCIKQLLLWKSHTKYWRITIIQY